MKYLLNCLGEWYERLPVWAAFLLFPLVAPIMLASGLLALADLLFVLPRELIFGRKQVESIAAKFTQAQVLEHAQSLDRLFVDLLAEHPDAADCVGVGPELERQLAVLAGEVDIQREEGR